MILTKEQQETMLEAANPLIVWLNKNCHPHCSAHVDQDAVELTEGIAKSYQGVRAFPMEGENEDEPG